MSASTIILITSNEKNFGNDIVVTAVKTVGKVELILLMKTKKLAGIL